MGLTKIQYTPEELQKKREEAERKVFALFLENTEICLLKKQNYLFWKCRLKKFNQGEERRDRANAWLHLQPHRSVTFILSSSKLHNHPSQCFLTSSDNKTVLGRFSGLHKLQILDFIFNDPTILGNFQVRRRDTNQLFSSPDDLDFFYKSDNARKMLFYFQVSFAKQELSLLMLFTFTFTFLTTAAGGDGGGSSCSREPEEGEGLGEKCGGNASQIQGQCRYKYKYSAKSKVGEN